MKLTPEQSAWLQKEKDKIEPKKGRRAKRKYIHFDKLINIIEPFHLDLVFDSNKVAKHSFYPFIRNTQRKKHYKKQPPGSPYKTRIVLKERPIDYGAHTDALILSWYSFQLATKYELLLHQLGLENNVIAYRSVGDGMSTYDHVKVVTDFIVQNPNYVAVALDVKEFFQKVDHNKLKLVWESILGVSRLPNDYYNIYKYVTDYRYVESRHLRKHLGFSRLDERKMSRVCEVSTFRNKIVSGGLLKRNPLQTKGIPQGSSISCVLSNAYMLPFDTVIKKMVSNLNGLYLRYSDDILILVPKDSVDSVTKTAEDFLEKELDLKINTQKTELTSFVEVNGFLMAQDAQTGEPSHLSYLGITFDGRRFYLRHKAIARHQKRMLAGVKRSRVIASVKKQSLPKHFPKYLRPGGPNTWTYADRVSRAINSPEIKLQTSDKRMGVKIKFITAK